MLEDSSELLVFPGVDDDVGAGVEDQQEVREHAHVRRPSSIH